MKQSKISRFFGGAAKPSPTTNNNSNSNNSNSNCGNKGSEDAVIIIDDDDSQVGQTKAPLTSPSPAASKNSSSTSSISISSNSNSNSNSSFAISGARREQLKGALDDIFSHRSRPQQDQGAATDKSKSTSHSSSSSSSLAAPKYTPLEKQVLELKAQHEDCLLLVECGYRMRFFGDDANAASKCLGIYAHKSHNFMVASVPTFRVVVHTRRLVSHGHRVAIVRQTETAAMKRSSDSKSSMFGRSVAGIFSPGCDVDEDDPAFQGLVTADGSSGSGGAGRDGEDDEDMDVDGGDEDGMEGEGGDNTGEGMAAGASSGLDFSDNWILTVYETSLPGNESMVGCLFLNIRGHCVHHTVIQADETRQSLLDETDIFQPSEVVVPRNISSLTLRALKSRDASDDTANGEGTNIVSYLKRVNYLPYETYDIISPVTGSVKPGKQEPSRQGLIRALNEEVDISWAHPSKVHKLIVSCLSGLSWFLFKMNSIFAISNPTLLQSISSQNSENAGGNSNSRNLPSQKGPPISFKLDGITARDLEVFSARNLSFSSMESAKGKSKSHNTVFSLLDRCRSIFGKRKLKLWLLNPLKDIQEIRNRQNCVEWVVRNGSYHQRYTSSWTKQISELLEEMPDLERFLTSLHNNKITPKSFVTLLQSVAKLEKLHTICFENYSSGSDNELPTLLRTCIENINPLAIAADSKTFLSELNIQSCLTNEYDNIFSEYSTLFKWATKNRSIDNTLITKFRECVELKSSLIVFEEEMQARLVAIRSLLKKPTIEFKTLRVGPTSKIEYLIELTIPESNAVPKNWTLVSSTKTVNRYHDPEVLRLLNSIQRSRDELSFASKACWQLFIGSSEKSLASSNSSEKLYKISISELHKKLRNVISELSTIDAILALADVANLPGYCKPNYSEKDGSLKGSTMSVRGARHPLAELQLEISGKSFIPNDIHITCDYNERSCLFITGPNMGGKSCYTLTVALIVLLGQIGSYVPADSANLIVYDNILTRMGADDDIASGQSTFMIELSRMRKMISMATSRSLLIVDELGRGTSTNDGVSIAMATAKYIINRIGCSMLFVTHYYLISKLITDPKVANCHMSYLEEPSEDASDENAGSSALKNIIFLYKLVEGNSKGSYGLNVARLAKISDDVLSRAHEMSLKMLESSSSLAEGFTAEDQGRILPQKRSATDEA